MAQNVRKSIPSISDLEEERIDTKKLILHEMYETRSTKFVASHMMTGELLAKDTLETVLNFAVEKIQEKYILSKQNPHVVKSSNNLIEMALGVNFTMYDSETFQINDDEEPSLINVDTWGRTKISTKKMNDTNRTEMVKPLSAYSMLSEEKKNIAKFKEKAKKFIGDTKSEIAPAPIDLNEPEPVNFEEDEMRQRKEREIARLHHEAELDKQAKEQAQQLKTIKKEADLKKKPFTYDYNGKIIPIHPAKIEKLPPSALPIAYTVQDAETQEKKKKGGSPMKASQNRISLMPKLSPVEKTGPILSTFTSSPPIFDLINPEKGVVFIDKDGGRVKKNHMTNQSHQVSLVGGVLVASDGHQRFTKTEYEFATRGGNLSRPSSERDIISAKEFKMPNDTASMTVKSEGVKEVDFHRQKTAKILQERVKGAGVKDVNFAAIEGMLRNEETDTLKSAPTAIQNATDKLNTEENTIKKSPIDLFNLEILNSKDWGKPSAPMSTNNLPVLPKAKDVNLKSSLGFKSRYPRDRATRFPLIKSSSDMMLRTYNS